MSLLNINMLSMLHARTGNMSALYVLQLLYFSEHFSHHLLTVHQKNKSPVPWCSKKQADTHIPTYQRGQHDATQLHIFSTLELMYESLLRLLSSYMLSWAHQQQHMNKHSPNKNQLPKIKFIPNKIKKSMVVSLLRFSPLGNKFCSHFTNFFLLLVWFVLMDILSVYKWTIVNVNQNYL